MGYLYLFYHCINKRPFVRDYLGEHTHTRLMALCSPGTTRVIRYQKGKTNLDFIQARDSEWQWHQLGHTQVCTSLQTNNHASTTTSSSKQTEKHYGLKLAKC